MSPTSSEIVRRRPRFGSLVSTAVSIHDLALLCHRMRPATAIVILILLAVIVIAGVFQLRSILAG